MDIEKKALLLFNQLYEKSKPKETENIDYLKEKMKYFDINPYLNYEIMKKMLSKPIINEEDANIFFTFYKSYIQTLFFYQKKDIINDIKSDKCANVHNLIKSNIGLNEKSFIDSYFDLLQIIYNKFEESRTSYGTIIKPAIIEELFTKFYYVDNYDINTPIVYGTFELIFSGFIYNLYNQLFLEKRKEEISKNNENNIDGFKNYPKLIIQKGKKYNQKQDMKVEEEIEEKVNNVDFESKIVFITRYIKLIITEEFKEAFDLENIKQENSYKVIPKVNALIFYLLYFDLVSYIYSLYENESFIKKFDEKFFFETRINKKLFFLRIPKEEYSIIDEQGNEIKDEKDIKNKNYKIINKKNENESIEFNPYNFILSEITSMNNYNKLLEELSNPKNFTLYKFFQENKLFNNDELFCMFRDNIKKMLVSETMKDLFEQYINFKDYIYPYSGEEKDNFISQTFNIIYYFPIPFKTIADYTYKQFGLIFINNNNRLEKIVNHKKKNDMNKQFCHKLNYIGFSKIVHIHEIIFHYTLVIIHSNNIEVPIKTPPEPLYDYYVLDQYSAMFTRYDGGDMGEAILLGNKLKYLTPKASIFILDNDNYQNNSDIFHLDYLETNKILKGEFLDLSKEAEKIELIGLLSKEMKVVGMIKLTNKTVSNFRTMEYVEEGEENDSYIDDYDKEEEDDDDGEEEEDEYSKQGISCFNISSHIFPYYERIKFK